MHAARVFLDYDQAQLDACYDQMVWAPNAQQVHRRQHALSAQVRARLAPPQRFAYGPRPMEHLDVYRTAQAGAPVLVFVHGGAWKANSSERYAFAAETFVNAGAHFVLIDFDGVEEMQHRLLPVAGQVRRAIAWVYGNAARFGGDRTRIHLAGHSSGAHLSGCALVTNWSEYGVPGDVIAGAICCSGMYELEPVRLSKRSAYVRFDDETVDALSALRHLERITMPVVLAYGTEESPEFQRQSRDFAAALTAAGKNVELLVGEGYNHFEMAETLGNPYGLLGRAALRQMQLA
ncbi:MAG: alpha/beta hydrolase [Candidatus Lustribacter sp.]|jgi:arylformamidase